MGHGEVISRSWHNAGINGKNTGIIVSLAHARDPRERTRYRYRGTNVRTAGQSIIIIVGSTARPVE